MKNVVIKYLSGLMAVWYCLSIIGFDMHSCSATGEIFVSSIAAGVTCDDIHPEYMCHEHGGCCGHRHIEPCCSHHGEGTAEEVNVAEDHQKCCTNDFKVLELTGTNSYENQEQFCQSVSVTCQYAGLCLASGMLPEAADCCIKYSLRSDSRVAMPDTQAYLNIWRI